MGDSQSSYNVVKGLIDHAEFKGLFHVSNMEDAILLLLKEKISIVLLDGDCPSVSVIKFSRIIRSNHPSSRIIVVTSENSTEFLVSMVNKGSVDQLIRPDDDPYRIYQLILQQHTKHLIIKTLSDLIRKPPKFSPAYYILHDSSLLDPDNNANFEFIGCVFSYKDTIRFSYFKPEFLNKDSTLISLYITAVNILGERLFKTNNKIDEINFEGISIIYYFDRGFQYAFLLRNLHNGNIEEAEKFVSYFRQQLTYCCYDVLESTKPITLDDDLRISNSIQNIVINHFGKEMTQSSNDNSNIVYYKPNGAFDREYSDEYIFVYDEQELKRNLFKHNIDILILPPNVRFSFDYKQFTSLLKEISPKLQIIQMLEVVKKKNVLYLIQDCHIDYLIPIDYNTIQKRSILEHAKKINHIIKSNISTPTPKNLQFSYQQEAIVYSLLRERTHYFKPVSTPMIRGITVLRHNSQFYTKLWTDNGDSPVYDNQQLEMFIKSLQSVISEIMQEEKIISTIGFGEDKIVVRILDDLTFIFFTRKVDFSNYFLTSKYIHQTCLELYHILSIANIPQSWNQELHFEIEQILIELFLKFSSIQVTN